MDRIIWESINSELKRQREHVELIASENFASLEVVKVAGTVLTNKYAEGLPQKRYYGGCEHVDTIEQIAIDRIKELFGADHANVQPHSGSQANAAAYMAVLKPGDTVLGMDLAAGGHLTHGHPLNFSATTYKFVSYGVTKDNEVIDYDEVERVAMKEKPTLIVAGASAYSRSIDFKRFREIADKAGALLMVDMAHIAGLVAAGEHESPIPYADIATSTTHKTLRGPRGGLILCKQALAKKIDRAVFPGQQGGPLEHIIAAKAIAFGEALTPEWKEYQKQVVKNSKAFASAIEKEGFRVISKGTDNHLFMLDVKSSTGLTGKQAETILHDVYITSNKNSIPFDTESPFKTSGLRFGTPAMTTRGFKEAEFEQVARIIGKVLKNHTDQDLITSCRNEILELTSKFTLYPDLSY